MLMVLCSLENWIIIYYILLLHLHWLNTDVVLLLQMSHSFSLFLPCFPLSTALQWKQTLSIWNVNTTCRLQNDLNLRCNIFLQIRPMVMKLQLLENRECHPICDRNCVVPLQLLRCQVCCALIWSDITACIKWPWSYWRLHDIIWMTQNFQRLQFSNYYSLQLPEHWTHLSDCKFVPCNKHSY